MKLHELADALQAKQTEEAAKGWDGLDGVVAFGYQVPAPEWLRHLSDAALSSLGIYLDQPGFLGFAYLGEGLHPAVIGGPSFAEVDWRLMPGVDAHHISNLAQLGDRDECRVLGHLLAYAAGVDGAIDRGLMRGAVE